MGMGGEEQKKAMRSGAKSRHTTGRKSLRSRGREVESRPKTRQLPTSRPVTASLVRRGIKEERETVAYDNGMWYVWDPTRKQGSLRGTKSLNGPGGFRFSQTFTSTYKTTFRKDRGAPPHKLVAPKFGKRRS